jgi:PAS domain S-box-containing protein
MSDLHQFHQDLIEGSALPIHIITQPTGEGAERLCVNESFLKLFGYATKDEFLALPLWSCTAPHDLDRVTKIRLGRRTNETVPMDYEYDALKKDGTIFPVQVFVQSIIWNGKAAVQCTYIDLTARKQAEAALRQSEEKFRTLGESAPVGIFETDLEGKCIYVNERWCEIAGLTEHEVLGDDWAQAIHSEDREMVFEQWSAAVARPMPFRLEYRFQRPDGSVSWVLGQAAAKTDNKDRITGHVGTLTDITERKEADRFQERFLHAIDNLPQQVGLYDSSSRLVYCNEEFRQTAGEGADLLVPGTTLDDVLRIRLQYANAPEQAKGREEEWIAERVRRFHAPSSTMDFERDGRAFEIRNERLPDGGRMVIVTDITDRKRAEDALRQSESRFRDLIEGSNLGILITNQNKDRLYANLACAELFGYETPDEILLVSHLGLSAAQNGGTSAKYLQALLEGEAIPPSYELEGLRKDGSTIHLQVFMRRILWEGQESIQRTFIDLTQRKQAEYALRTSEERLGGITQNAADGIVTISAEGIIESFNTAAGIIFGYAADEVVGQNVKILMPEADSSRHDGYLRSYLRTGVGKILGVGPREVVGLRKDGSAFPMDLAIGELLIGERRVFIGIARDITDRKQIERALQESETRYRDIAEAWPDAMLVTHRDQRIMFANTAALELFGAKTAEQLLGRDMIDLVHPKDREGVLKRRERSLQGHTASIMERTRLRLDGSEFPSESRGVGITWEGEAAILIIIRDITDRKRTEAALRESETQLRVIADVSPVMIQYTDKDKIIRFSNKAFAARHGYTPEEVVGKHRTEIWGNDSHQSIIGEIEETLAGDVTHHEGDREYADGTIHVNGGAKWGHWAA